VLRSRFLQVVLSLIRESNEAHVSTQSPPPPAHAWVPGAYAHQERPYRSQTPSGERSQATVGELRRPENPGTWGSSHRHHISVFKFTAGSRLRARHEFTAVQDAGRRVATRYMTLLGRVNALERDRLGIVASRKLGGAVVRNRAKRRLREVFRRGLLPGARPPADRTLDLVVIARRALVDAPFALVEADFQNALRRLRGPR
jgi:ribonuclease P protein component